MRVLVLTNMYPSDEKPAYGVFVRDQVEDLRKLGVEVKVLAFAGYNGWVSYARATLALRSELRSSPFDLIHAHYGLSGAVALAQFRVPLVTTFHGSDTYIWWHRVISWLVARRGTPIFVSKDRARALSLPTAVVIPSGVDTAVFRPIPQSEARRAIGWDEKQIYVLFPGAREAAVKRFDLFQQVVGLARQVLPNLEAVCLEDFERREIPLVMNAIDATLLTSDHEGSPVAVRESLACLTPVVSVPAGDVARVIVGLPGCFIASREPPDLTQRLVDAVRAGKCSALRARAEFYSRERMARRLLAVYQSVLDPQRRNVG
jgi:glycosyltransferase involved in cell wall biosynthesis